MTTKVRYLARLIPSMGRQKPSSFINKDLHFTSLRKSTRLFFSSRLPLEKTACMPSSTFFTQTSFKRSFSTNDEKKQENEATNPDMSEDPKTGTDDAMDDGKDLTLYQRFKAAYKTHGKILIGVHVCTSVCWLGSFYAITSTGVDVIGFLQNMNFPEFILKHVRDTPVGDIAVSYLLYKIASPVRYMVTLAGTQMFVKHFRKIGRIPELREEDKLRNLAKEGRATIKEKAMEGKETLKERYEDRKETINQMVEDRRQSLQKRRHRLRRHSSKGLGPKSKK